MKRSLALAILAIMIFVPKAELRAYPGDLTLEDINDETIKNRENQPQNVKEGDKPLQQAEQEKLPEDPQASEKAKEAQRLEEEQRKLDEKARQEAYKKAQQDFESSQCLSTPEYIATLKFFRSTQVMLVTEEAARKIANKVSRGCDGASERFIKVLKLLKAIGLSDKSAMGIALDFSSRSTEVQKNFLEIFTHSFLAEFFDYDYQNAVQLAFELSKDYKGDAKQVREDFIELVRFCKDGNKLDLPAKLCAAYTIRLARLSQFHPKGIRKDFYQLYERFRDDRTFAMDIKTALETSFNILKNGPRATENFFSAYDFAVAKDGLDMTQGEALNFGLKMASRSYRGERPAFVPVPFEPVVVRNAASVR